ncbi:MAG: diaminopimelate epimerase [Deltaproteobacteria bacterium]|nr:diaminopimelate epimerase [Deltaproteobacteria bacterium]MBW2071908.1 diaminopimelate epimerase [Deltaproteobacteria bacterium]
MTMITDIIFYKMSGSGNDFVLIDNRSGKIAADKASELARSICRRKLSVGADGLILIENDEEVDFRWQFYNADGSSAEMCGNGGRCAARLAYMLGISGRVLSFRTAAGIIRAEVLEQRVKLQITQPRELVLDESLELKQGTVTVHRVNTGVPHAVLLVDSQDALERIDVEEMGREIRYHQRSMPAGTNVNFIALGNDGSVRIRTYERGVEGETLACGTGAAAAALVAAAKGLSQPPTDIHVRSGEVLTIHFEAAADLPETVYLEGEAALVYEGRLAIESLQHLQLMS